MISLEELHKLEKIWHKAFDASRAAEASTDNKDKIKYWLRNHMAYQIQDRIREKLKALSEQYISDNIELLMEEYDF